MKISATILEAILAKMADSATGFNLCVGNAAPGYKINRPYTLDFPPSIYDNSTDSFYLGRISPDDIADFGTSNLTRVCLYAVGEDNMAKEKPRDFSGDVEIGLDFHLQSRKAGNKENFLALALLTADALGQVFLLNRQQVWPGGITYNGGYVLQYGGVSVPKSEANWRQMLTLTMAFDVESGPQ